MKFDDCISFLYGGEALERIASSYAAPVSSGLFMRKKTADTDKLIYTVTAAKEKYCDTTRVIKALSALSNHDDLEVGTVFPVLLRNILLEKNDYCYETNSVTLEVMEYERDIIKKASKLSLKKLTPEAEAYNFLLKSAYDGGRRLTGETASVVGAMKNYYRIGTEEEYILLTSLGIYPCGIKFVAHTTAQIENVRQELQKSGLLFSIRKTDGVIYDIIPSEIADIIKQYFGVEMKSAAYGRIIEFVLSEYKKQYVINILTSFGITTPEKPTAPQLTALVMKYLKPGELMGGSKNSSEGLNRQALSAWCAKLGMNRLGSKPALIAKLIDYYEHSTDTDVKSDYRVRYYKDYAGLAALNTDLLKTELTHGTEGLFAETTNFVFEIMLSVRLDRPLSKTNLTGRIKSDDKLYLYTAVASEKPVELSEHMQSIYTSVAAEGEKSVAALIMVAPGFTEESARECVRFYVETDTQLCLIKAADLKELADKWASRTGSEEFPVKYLRQNGCFDIKNCDFIV